MVTGTSELVRVLSICDYYGLWHGRPRSHDNDLVSVEINAEIIYAAANFLLRPLSVIEPITCEIPSKDSELSAGSYLKLFNFWVGKRPSNILRQAVFFAFWNLLAVDGQIQVGSLSCVVPDDPSGCRSGVEPRVSQQIPNLDDGQTPESAYGSSDTNNGDSATSPGVNIPQETATAHVITTTGDSEEAKCESNEDSDSSAVGGSNDAMWE